MTEGATMAEETSAAAVDGRRPVGSTGRATVLARVIVNEIAKGLRNFWANRLAVGTGMVSFGALYLGMMFVIGRGRLPDELLPLTVLGMAAYATLWIGSIQLVGDQLEEMRAGTLEQTHLSPVPPALLILGRVVSTGLQGLLVAAALVATVAVGAEMALPWRWGAVVPLALTLVQALAFSLLFAGVTLAVPFVGEVHHVAVSLIAFFNGAFLPVAQFPDWLQALARLLPTTLGIEATIDLLHGGSSLAELAADGTLPALAAYTAALGVLAWVVYARNYRRALVSGDLGRY